jgi:hypothetical protein
MPSSSNSLSLSKKGSGGKPSIGSTGSLASGETEEDYPSAGDQQRVNSDGKFAERQRAEGRTQALESARVASSRGDRRSEIRLLAQVLEGGATGYERVESLKRLCDAYEDLGEPEHADPFCDQLLSEFPNTAAAKMVEDRRKRVQRAPPAPAPKAAAPNRDRRSADEKKAVDSVDSAAPASSY